MSYIDRHHEEIKNIKSSVLVIRHIEEELKKSILLPEDLEDKSKKGFLNYISKLYH